MESIHRVLRLAGRALPLLAALCAAPAGAQTLYGRVTDAVDGSGVTAAQVAAVDSTGATAAWTLSGRDGRFELELPAGGSFRLHVHRVGFRDGISPAVAIAQGDRMGVDLSLRAEAFRLQGIEARVRVTPPFRDRRARGFYERMDRGRGLFYTAEQIAGLNRVHPTEVITYYAGINVVNGRLWMGGDRRGCSPALYIDGHYRPGEFLDNELEPGDIWGIEIYRYAWEIPNDLPRDDMAGTCGIVMIWTSHS
ncbi:MAG TPA: carboxypeptidase-like regulatory domain-containing protein [Longimicrobium sp.]